MDKIIIIGSSGHAKVVINVVERENRYEIIGLLDRFRAVGEETLGYQVLGREEDLPDLVKEYKVKGILIAIGDNFIRSKVASLVSELCPDLPFISTVHPNSSIAKQTSIKEGTVIMAGTIVSPCCSIGRFCILNTKSSIAHESSMEDFSSLAPGVTTGGNCRIGAFSAICIGVVLVQDVQIGEHTVVGAGSTVLQNLGSSIVAYGSPAITVRKRNPGDKYL